MVNHGKALVVDDCRDWREELKELLQDKGFEVVTAGDLRTALSVLGNESFDTAIIDVNLTEGMPSEEGLLINSYIQDNAPNTEVILISVKSFTDRRLRDIHPARFIEKSNLWSKLNELLE
jgi:DNA-binding NtrC family response regulator